MSARTVEDLKAEIFGKFRADRAVAGDLLNSLWFNYTFLPGLDRQEQTNIELLFKELVDGGLVEVAGKLTKAVRLTEKGESVLRGR